jgi:hypothetical protein
MAFATRSSVFAFVEEVTEGEPVDPAASDFTVVREGASFAGAVNTVTSDELRNSIGASKSFVTSQAPTASIPKYLKPSGTEGVAPDYSILIESCLGAVDVNSTEYTTVAASTAGTASTRANLKVTAGVEANFQKGQAVLIKDATNNYAVRNVWDGITSTNLPLSFNLGVAPASGVALGKAVLYLPSTDQPTFTSHMYQAAASTSAVHQMIAGSRTTAMNIEFTANELASVTFEIGGIQYFINPIEISSLNNKIDFTDSVGTVAATLSSKFYATPIDLANEITSKMTAASVASAADIITCTWSNTTGKFTIVSDGTVLSLLWLTGANTATSAKTALGFNNTDDTAALTYTSDNALTYNPAVTPTFDSQPPQVVRDNMLELGTFADYLCVGGQALSISIATPKTDVPNWCAETGIDESVVLSREVTISGTLKFAKHDVQRFYNLINNVETQLAFVHGQKLAGNWVPGTIVSIFCPTCSITSNTIADQDGYIVEQFEATAFVGDDLEDIYINML